MIVDQFIINTTAGKSWSSSTNCGKWTAHVLRRWDVISWHWGERWWRWVRVVAEVSVPWLKDKLISRRGNEKSFGTYSVHWCRVTKPRIVHLFDVSCARAIKEGFSSGWVVAFNSWCGNEIISDLKSNFSWRNNKKLMKILTWDFCWRTNHEPKFCWLKGARRLKAVLARCIFLVFFVYCKKWKRKEFFYLLACVISSLCFFKRCCSC